MEIRLEHGEAVTIRTVRGTVTVGWVAAAEEVIVSMMADPHTAKIEVKLPRVSIFGSQANIQEVLLLEPSSEGITDGRTAENF